MKTLTETTAAARAFALASIPEAQRREGDRGHARYFDTDERGDIFLTGTSGRYLPCHWDIYVSVSKTTGEVRAIPQGEMVFGYRPEAR